MRIGRQETDLHVRGAEFEPRTAHPGTGTGDFCPVTQTPLDEVQQHLTAVGVPVEVGPVTEPDQNPVEISAY